MVCGVRVKLNVGVECDVCTCSLFIVNLLLIYY